MAAPETPRTPAAAAVAAAVVILLWAGYTALQTLFVTGRIGEPRSALLGFVPGALGLGALMAAGLRRRECFLTLAPLSRRGFWVLAGLFVFALAATLPFGVWQGWSWRTALLYAPAAGVSQELFFRSALLPAMGMIMRKRAGAGLILHAALFGLWHIGPLFAGAPAWAVAAVMLVPFLSGVGWGWQVQRDGTVVWAMAQHTLIWAIVMQFAFSG